MQIFPLSTFQEFGKGRLVYKLLIYTTQKMKLPIQDFFSKGNCGFGHIYWKNLSEKTSSFVQWWMRDICMWWIFQHIWSTNECFFNLYYPFVSYINFFFYPYVVKEFANSKMQVTRRTTGCRPFWKNLK